MKADNGDLLQAISQRMHEIMEGETQVSLAKKLNVSQGNIAKYLQGKIIPRSDVIYHMILSKNINPAWFLTGKGPKVLGKGYDISKTPNAPKASNKVMIPYGVSKELKSIEERLKGIARKSPESLKAVKVFLNAIEDAVSPRKKRASK